MTLDWGALKAKDVMKRAVATLGPDDSLRDAAELFLRKNVSGAPVVDSAGRVFGVVSQTDLLRRTSEAVLGQLPPFYMEGEHLRVATPVPVHDLSPVKEAMSRNLVMVEEEVPLGDVASLMMERKVHRVLVTQGGRLTGILSAMDFVRLVAGEVSRPAELRRRTSRSGSGSRRSSSSRASRTRSRASRARA